MTENYYVVLPSSNRYPSLLNFSIVPQYHVQSQLELESDVYADIREYQRHILKIAQKNN
jgi:hypothetical protein